MNRDLPITNSSDIAPSDVEPNEPNPTDTDPANEEPDDASDLDFDDMPCTDDGDDDAWWEVFLPDEDECDPDPDPGDFWAAGSHDERCRSPGSNEPRSTACRLLVSPSLCHFV
jgi:hypothetical protein